VNELGVALATLSLLLVSAPGIAGPEFPAGEPRAHGMDAERLARISDVLSDAAEKTDTPGAVFLVMRRGHIVYEGKFGDLDLEHGVPMRSDAIFRIHSMTKPIVSVATMMLLEEGKLLLTDPVDRYLPEFKDVQVAILNEDESQIIGLEPVRRQMTIQDLLRHTSGFTGTTYGRDNAVKQLYRDMAATSGDVSNEEYTKNIASLPLNSQPGTQFEYGISTNILGRVVEVVSGETLGAFLDKRIFEPLGMKDTGFQVPRSEWHRVAQGFDPETGGRPWYLGDPSVKKKMESGAGGLWSTIGDYAVFTQLILSRGEVNGVRLLGSKSIDLMTSNHLGPTISPGPLYLPGAGHGFGLGFAVRTADGLSGHLGSKGEVRWGGWAGTQFWIDPAEELVCIWMIQDPADSGRYRTLFKNLVYQAIID
jgi:CubicO group peptidase (beta-lactamase class C family)